MPATITINGPARVSGSLRVPGDKSISHRVAMLASIASGSSTITGFASSADCGSTLDCIKRLGIRVDQDPHGLVIHGQGLGGFHPPTDPVRLDAGNSGSTIRMISGLLAGQRFLSVIDGDSSLRRRPMARVIEPLRLMGAQIEARDGNLAPLKIRGGSLRPIQYASPVASAQGKTCVLLAALFAEGTTTFSEPAQSRNHTELMLQEFGARIVTATAESSGAMRVEGIVELRPVNYTVPGDLSSAAFFIAAAAVLPGSSLILRGVNLNPTRAAFIDVLRSRGADIRALNVHELHREPLADLVVNSRPLAAKPAVQVLSGSLIPSIIDEIPMLAVVATQVEGRVEVRDAKELRVKESDRIRTVVDGIRRLGGKIEEFEDGFAIIGPQQLAGGRVDAAGDHRIAMAFSIAGLMARGTTTVVGADCASVSFPEFYELLGSVVDEGRIQAAPV